MVPVLAQGLTVLDDFSYPALSAGASLDGSYGGFGWAGPWRGGSGIFFQPDVNLIYESYRLDETKKTGSLYSQTSNYRAICRDLETPVSGEIWFSYLFRTGGSGSGGLMFNATDAHTPAGSSPSAWKIFLDSSDANNRKLTVTVNGITTLVKSGIVSGAEYFVLGRLRTGTQGSLDLWLNSDFSGVTDLAQFTAVPDFSATGATNPESIFSVGVIAYRSGIGGSSIFRLDALRLSDGDGTADAAFADTAFAGIDGASVRMGRFFHRIQTNRRFLSTPIISMPEQSLATLVNNGLIISRDGMRSWESPLRINPAYPAGDVGSRDGVPAGGGALIRLKSDKLLVLWRDDRYPAALVDYWDAPVCGNPVPGARGDIWCLGSPDNGTSWTPAVKIFEGPGGYPPRPAIQTRQGTVVSPVQYHAGDPGRNVITVLYSHDDGQSWGRSADIDIGGAGHHDGAFEATLVELLDGRLWLLMRTSHDRFYQSFSGDQGHTWTTAEPSGIPASSSPGCVTRLSSGRLALLWNRLWPENNPNSFSRRGGDSYYSEKAASWHRQELSLTVSDDDGLNWRRPLVVARHPMRGGRLSYPMLFQPGSDSDHPVYVFANQGKIEAQVREAALLLRTVHDDFDTVPVTQPAAVRGCAGGWGWRGTWQGSITIMLTPDLDLTEGTNAHSGYGLLPSGRGSLYSTYNSFRAVNRGLVEPLHGEIWFSYLMRFGADGSGGIQLNPSLQGNTHVTAPAPHRIEVTKNADLTVTFGDGLSQVAASGVAVARNHLVLGRMILAPDSARLEVWLNPAFDGIQTRADFLEQCRPAVSESLLQFGTQLDTIGVIAWNGSSAGSVFRFDALRASDGEGDSDTAFYEAVGIGVNPRMEPHPFPPRLQGWIGPDSGFSFLSEPGSVYRFERSDRLNPAFWESIQTGVTGSGGKIEVNDSERNGTSSGFYRLMMIP